MPKCPICKENAVVEFRPFCSRRCADMDLGRWFDGSYAVPSDAVEEDELPADDHTGTKH